MQLCWEETSICCFWHLVIPVEAGTLCSCLCWTREEASIRVFFVLSSWSPSRSWKAMQLFVLRGDKHLIFVCHLQVPVEAGMCCSCLCRAKTSIWLFSHLKSQSKPERYDLVLRRQALFVFCHIVIPVEAETLCSCVDRRQADLLRGDKQLLD